MSILHNGIESNELGDMGHEWRRNLEVVLNRNLSDDDRLEALWRIDDLFGGERTRPEDLESVAAELEANEANY